MLTRYAITPRYAAIDAAAADMLLRAAMLPATRYGLRHTAMLLIITRDGDIAAFATLLREFYAALRYVTTPCSAKRLLPRAIRDATPLLVEPAK